MGKDAPRFAAVSSDHHQMFAEIDLVLAIGNLRHAKQRRDLGEDFDERAAAAQGLDQSRRRRAHQPANQLRPYPRGVGVDEMAGLDLFEQQVERFLVRVVLGFGEQRRHAQHGEAGVGLSVVEQASRIQRPWRSLVEGCCATCKALAAHLRCGRCARAGDGLCAERRLLRVT